MNRLLGALVGRWVSGLINNRGPGGGDPGRAGQEGAGPAADPTDCVSSRALALAVDWFPVALAAAVLRDVVLSNSVSANVIYGSLATPFIPLVFLAALAYFTAFEAVLGATPGKLATGLRVYKKGTEEPPGLQEVFIRNALRAVDSLPAFYIVGSLVARFTPDHQRVGDLLAGTVVARRRVSSSQPSAQAPVGSRSTGSEAAKDRAPQAEKKPVARKPVARKPAAEKPAGNTGRSAPPAEPRAVNPVDEVLSEVLKAVGEYGEYSYVYRHLSGINVFDSRGETVETVIQPVSLDGAARLSEDGRTLLVNGQQAAKVWRDVGYRHLICLTRAGFEGPGGEPSDHHVTTLGRLRDELLAYEPTWTREAVDQRALNVRVEWKRKNHAELVYRPPSSPNENREEHTEAERMLDAGREADLAGISLPEAFPGEAPVISVVGEDASPVAYNLAGLLARASLAQASDEEGRRVLFVDAVGAITSKFFSPQGYRKPDELLAGDGEADIEDYVAQERSSGLYAMPHPDDGELAAGELAERARSLFDCVVVACGGSIYAKSWLLAYRRGALLAAGPDKERLLETAEWAEQWRDGGDGDGEAAVLALMAPAADAGPEGELFCGRPVFRLPPKGSAAYVTDEANATLGALKYPEVGARFRKLLLALLPLAGGEAGRTGPKEDL